MLTPEQLAEIKARAEAATEGPWDVTDHSHVEEGCRCLSCWATTGWHLKHQIDCEDVAAQIPDNESRPSRSCSSAVLSYEDAEFVAHGRTDVPALLAEVERLTAQRDRARENALEVLERNDEFVNELCTLIPDDRDDDIGAEAIIIGWVKELLARLKAAEDVATVCGWIGISSNSDRQRAASTLYNRWIDVVGLDFAGPDAHRDLDIAALAREYDEKRARTVAKIRSDAPTELPGGEG